MGDGGGFRLKKFLGGDIQGHAIMYPRAFAEGPVQGGTACRSVLIGMTKNGKNPVAPENANGLADCHVANS